MASTVSCAVRSAVSSITTTSIGASPWSSALRMASTTSCSRRCVGMMTLTEWGQS